MPTQAKVEIIEEYAQKFKNASSIFLTDFKGISVEEDTNLRRAFREAGVEYRVLKNTLAKRALNNAGISELDDLLKGVTAFAFSDTDPVSPVKVLKTFLKASKSKKDLLSIKGCVFEGKYFDAQHADALSELPSREALLGQFVGMLQSPLNNLMNVMQASGRKLVGVLEELKNQKAA